MNQINEKLSFQSRSSGSTGSSRCFCFARKAERQTEGEANENLQDHPGQVHVLTGNPETTENMPGESHG